MIELSTLYVIYCVFLGNNLCLLTSAGLPAASSRSGDTRKHNSADFR